MFEKLNTNHLIFLRINFSDNFHKRIINIHISIKVLFIRMLKVNLAICQKSNKLYKSIILGII